MLSMVEWSTFFLESIFAGIVKVMMLLSEIAFLMSIVADMRLALTWFFSLVSISSPEKGAFPFATLLTTV